MVRHPPKSPNHRLTPPSLGPETLQSILTARPNSKDSFTALSKQVMSAIISRHESNPLYAIFAEQLAKDLCETLTAVQTRKVSSTLSVLGNTKQQEERDKASGKKKVRWKDSLGFQLIDVDGK